MSEHLLTSGEPDALHVAFELLVTAYEAGGLPVSHEEWARLTPLFSRLDREGISTATEAELAWLLDLEERATHSLELARVAGPGRDRAIARVYLIDDYRRRRRERSESA